MADAARSSPLSNTTSASSAIHDILPLVFDHARPPYDGLSNIPLPSLRDSPLNITHVCRLWRNIALATPCLWSTIRFEINAHALEPGYDDDDLGQYLSFKRFEWEVPDSKGPGVFFEWRYKRKKRILERRLDWVRLWLSRLGSNDEVPLDLCVMIQEFQDRSHKDYNRISGRVRGIVSDMIEQRTRWRDVKMDVHFSLLPLFVKDIRVLEDLTHNRPVPANALMESATIKLTLDKLTLARSLSIRIYSDTPHRDAQLPIGVFLDASHSSRLRELDIQGRWPRLRLDPESESELAGVGTEVGFVQGAHIPSLKRVELQSEHQFTFDSLVAFLSAISQSIEEFVGVMPCSGPRGASSSRKDSDKIIMPNLHTLVLDLNFTSELSNMLAQHKLLRILEAPKITNLQVTLPQGPVDARSLGRSVARFMSRSLSQFCATGPSEHSSRDGGEVHGLMHLKIAGTYHGDWLVAALPELSNLRSIELHVGIKCKAAVHAVLVALLGTNSPNLPCPLLEKISFGEVAVCEDTVAAIIASRTQPSPSAPHGTLRCVDFRNSRLVNPDPIRNGLVRERQDRMEIFMWKKEVREALKRGLKIDFAH